MPFLSKIIIYTMLVLLPACLFPSSGVFAGNPEIHWQKFETDHAIINYVHADHIETFQKSIRFGKEWWATTSSFAHFSEQENQKIAALKTDAVFKRVQEILGMVKKIKKVTILLYPDKTTLDRAYLLRYKTQSPYRAWYDYSIHTISLNVSDCHEGILAHELAHSIIDNFLKVRPPENTSEILARYVDRHLK